MAAHPPPLPNDPPPGGACGGGGGKGGSTSGCQGALEAPMRARLQRRLRHALWVIAVDFLHPKSRTANAVPITPQPIPLPLRRGPRAGSVPHSPPMRRPPAVRTAVGRQWESHWGRTEATGGADRHAKGGAKRHQHEHRPQRPTERSDPTQHAKGRTGDRPGPRKGATTRRHVTQGGGGGGAGTPAQACAPPPGGSTPEAPPPPPRRVPLYNSAPAGGGGAFQTPRPPPQTPPLE